MKAFGDAFRLDDSTFNTYKDKYEQDLEARSGEKHHILPVPTVYLIDSKGVIKYAFSDPDHKVRLNGKDLMTAAKEALK